MKRAYSVMFLSLAMGCGSGATAGGESERAGDESSGGGETAASSVDDTAEPTVAASGPSRSRWDSPTTSCRLQSDYNRCIVTRLDGHTETEGELISLIQSQRILGDADGAKRNMGLFVDKYPDSPQSMTYRDALETQ